MIQSIKIKFMFSTVKRQSCIMSDQNPIFLKKCWYAVKDIKKSNSIYLYIRKRKKL